jgi:hypothetical protein
MARHLQAGCHPDVSDLCHIQRMDPQQLGTLQYIYGGQLSSIVISIWLISDLTHCLVIDGTDTVPVYTHSLLRTNRFDSTSTIPNP